VLDSDDAELSELVLELLELDKLIELELLKLL